VSSVRRPLIAGLIALVVGGGAVAAVAAHSSGSSAAAGTTTSTATTTAASTSAATAPALATTSVAPTTTAAASTTTGPHGSRPITVAFGGDVHAEPPISGVLAAGKSPFEFVAPLLSKADVAVANLETTLGTAGTAQIKKYVFRAPDSIVQDAKAAGIDVLGTANNHSYDYGQAGLLETIQHITATGIQQIGSGNTATEAYAPAIIDVRGTKVAILGIARVGPSDAGRATATRPGTTNGHDVAATLAAIKAAKQQAPIVIVFIHWGIELAACPQIDDKNFAQQMLDAGASAVVGAHPHVLQGVSNPPGKLVAYSVGNFVFYAHRPAARQTGVLTISFSPDDGSVTGYSFDPALIDAQGRPVPLTGTARDQAIANYAKLSPGQGPC
jgi:poly-gamma-glutamate capsule biosynthesis protein CapA/YwtB (metallophosphatase superfamily)